MLTPRHARRRRPLAARAWDTAVGAAFAPVMLVQGLLAGRRRRVTAGHMAALERTRSIAERAVAVARALEDSLEEAVAAREAAEARAEVIRARAYQDAGVVAAVHALMQDWTAYQDTTPWRRQVLMVLRANPHQIDEALNEAFRKRSALAADLVVEQDQHSRTRDQLAAASTTLQLVAEILEDARAAAPETAWAWLGKVRDVVAPERPRGWDDL